MLTKLRIEIADWEAGHAAAQRLNERVVPEPLAVTVFEHGAKQFRLEAYFPAAPSLDDVALAIADLRPSIGHPTLEAVPDQNWVALSQAALPPIRAGRFCVHGSHDRGRFAMRPHAIEIDAGEAFGTGHNATTAGCLEALDVMARRRRFAHVLDLGCGSGVLAIAAARTCPQARVLASDNDPVATAVAAHNVRLNRVTSRVHILPATGFLHPLLRGAQDFDLILSNLLPGPLIALAPGMRHALARGGIAILSGILNPQAREVVARYRAAGFRLLRRREGCEWTILTLQRA
jgi:ribosomal protein L11 methyltransferase